VVVGPAATTAVSATGADTGATTTAATTGAAAAEAEEEALRATTFLVSATTGAGAGAATVSGTAAVLVTFLEGLGAAAVFIVLVVGVFWEDILRTTLFCIGQVVNFLKTMRSNSGKITAITFFFEKITYHDRTTICMRNLCNKFIFFALSIFSGQDSIETPMEGADSSGVRICANTKSKRHPDKQCEQSASHGDFCFRHWKRPHRYVPLLESQPKRLTRQTTREALRLASWWKQVIPLRKFRTQGPAIHDRSLSNNDTEVYSMDSVKDISSLYFFSFSDSNKHIWSFDIRSLSHLMAVGRPLNNPYTRETLNQETTQKIRDRINWLRTRKYPLLYIQGEGLTPEQHWNQRVLDVFMKMESLGYLSGSSWFEQLSLRDNKFFYRALFELWTYRLGLSPQEKEGIVPRHSKSDGKLFKQTPEMLLTRNHDLHWWKKTNLNTMNTLLTRSTDKTKQALGALYILMGLVQVSDDAADAYPWILETIS
jgi:hypothetical protein